MTKETDYWEAVEVLPPDVCECGHLRRDHVGCTICTDVAAWFANTDLRAPCFGYSPEEGDA